MKKSPKIPRIVTLLALLCVAMIRPSTITAHDFAVANSDGSTIYYVKLTSETVAVSYKGDRPLFGAVYTGDVVIPSTVTFSDTTYSVTSIGDQAFYSCSGLKSVTIPSSVTKIGSSAFDDCSGLTSVDIPNSVTEIRSYAFSCCRGLTSVTIPNSVKSISDQAFYSCSGLKSVTIPNSVTSIGYKAFYNCSALTSVTIGSSVTKIGSSAFYGCSGLKTVNYNAISCSSMGSLNYPVFDGCTGITTLNIGANVTKIPSQAFDGCSGLKSVTIPNSVTSIGEYAFFYCSGLTSVTLGNSVTSIGESAFYCCRGLTSVTIPNSVTSIGVHAFYYCSGLKSVTIGNSVTSIGKYAFKSCSGLISVTIPNSVTSIGAEAFYGCSGLISMTIPGTVTSIGGYAFEGCSGLQEIFSYHITPGTITLDSIVFSGVPTSSCVLKVPRHTKELYQACSQWKDFANIEEFFITGDANIDYGVTVADVSTTISHILGNNPSTFDEEAADVNGNGNVNVADATLITNIVLNQPSVAFALPARMPAMFEQASKASLSMSDVAIDELIGHVSVDNASDFVALQFEVNVPEGLTIENVSSDENHTVAFNSIGDNVYRVIIYSLANTPFQSDEVASFSFRQNGNVEVGSEIDFSSVLVNENINGEINEYQIVATPAYVTEWSSIQHIINMDTKIRVKNGELLIDADSECDVKIVSLDGIVIIKHLIPGTNSISLPKGLYIINGVKVLL